MSLTSLGLRSEMLALCGVSTLSFHDGYAVQVSPDEPDYWMGNQLILQDTARTPEEVMDLFARHFPQSSHRSIVWDIPGLDPAPIAAAYAPFDCALDAFDALACHGLPQAFPAPEGITFRALSGDADWQAAFDLQVTQGKEWERNPETHIPYLRRRNAARRRQIALGLGEWFGAFEDGVLVAQMGMFLDADIARYQNVITRASHRGRGICRALLHHVAAWGLARHPRAQLVIVADAESDAGRLYRRCGFAHVETCVGVLHAGY